MVKIPRLFRKKSKLEKIYLKNKEFINYCLISMFCSLVFYVVYLVLNILTNDSYIFSNVVAYITSFTLLFILDQKLFNAKREKTKDKIKEVMAFVIARLIGLPLDSYILYLFVEYALMDVIISKLITSLIMFIYNYAANKLFVFKKLK